VTQNRKKRSGSSTNGVIVGEEDLLTSKRVRTNKVFFEDSQICANRRKPIRTRRRQTKKSSANLMEITSDKIFDVVTLHRHNEVDIKNVSEDVAVSHVHDDDTLGATQIIDILSKLYRATFGC
jgi:hypothetical protein